MGLWVIGGRWAGGGELVVVVRGWVETSEGLMSPAVLIITFNEQFYSVQFTASLKSVLINQIAPPDRQRALIGHKNCQQSWLSVQCFYDLGQGG